MQYEIGIQDWRRLGYVYRKIYALQVKPKDKALGDLGEIVQEHIYPKPSEAVERCSFHQASQSQTESIVEFVARLKKLSLHCNFNDLQTALRDQFICGIREHDTKIKLFRQDGLTFEKAYKIATACEEAKKNATKMENLVMDTPSTSGVHTLRPKLGKNVI
ncbi:hypothetical protein ACS0PU_002646 [Formica fusca]